jgi:hypothetical protein
MPSPQWRARSRRRQDDEMVEIHRPGGLDVLEPGYDELFERLVETCVDDERVRAMWLSGSLARGVADAVSDLDVLLALADDAIEGFASSWREWLARVTPTVIARPLPFLPGSFFSVTTQRLRMDVVVEPATAIASTFFRERALVFDRDGLDAVVPEPLPGAGPSPTRIADLIEEFFRDYGMFPVGVERKDWLLGVEAIHLIRTLLYQLFVEENAPVPAAGVKQWSSKLTPRQREVLLALPTGGTDRDSIVEAHEAVSVAFVREARRVAAAAGVEWPAELEQRTVEYLRR